MRNAEFKMPYATEAIIRYSVVANVIVAKNIGIAMPVKGLQGKALFCSSGNITYLISDNLSY